MRQALEMALEALGESQQILDEYATEFIFTRQKNNDAINAIKEALAQPEQCDCPKEGFCGFGSRCQDAQQEQEPVAWADHGVVNWIVDKQFKHASYLYEGSPPAPSKACIYCGQLVIKEKNT